MERLGGFEIFDKSLISIDFSGAGQGKAPKPPTKIRGTQHTQRQEKIRNIPRPQPTQKPR